MAAKKRKRKPVKARELEPGTYLVQFQLVAIPGQFFYARFTTRYAALQFVNFDDADVILSAALL